MTPQQQALACIRGMLEGTGIRDMRFKNREGNLPGLTHEGEDYENVSERASVFRRGKKVN